MATFCSTPNSFPYDTPDISVSNAFGRPLYIFDGQSWTVTGCAYLWREWIESSRKLEIVGRQASHRVRVDPDFDLGIPNLDIRVVVHQVGHVANRDGKHQPILVTLEFKPLRKLPALDVPTLQFGQNLRNLLFRQQAVLKFHNSILAQLERRPPRLPTVRTRPRVLCRPERPRTG